MRGLVVRVDLAEISSDGSYMVSDNVNHHPDPLRMRSVDQIDQVLLGTEIRIDVVPVLRPVAMIPIRCVLHNWTDPNRIESHPFDVVKL